MNRVAVLVANAHKEPFLSINSANLRKSSEILENFSFDLFYYEGRQAKPLEEKFRDTVESIRYKKIWPLLKLYDSIVLNFRWKSIETARLISKVGVPNRLISSSPEDLRHLAVKFYASLQYCIEKDYDFVLRTTSNSFFNLKNIVSQINHDDSSRILYLGRKLELANRSPIISGSFLLLNRAAMLTLKSRIPYHDHSVLDDVGIGNILGNAALNVEPTFANSIDFESVEAIEALPIDDLARYTHYRCKTRVVPRNDEFVLRKLVSRLTEAGIQYI